MKKRYAILITIVTICLSVCVAFGVYMWVDYSVRSSKPYSATTTEEQLEKVIMAGNYIIIDARPEAEYEKGHVVGAVNIPYDRIEEDIGSYIGLDEKDVIVYSGNQEESDLACELLIELGYGGLSIGAYDAITLGKE